MNKMERLRVNWKKNWQLHLMLFPGILLILLFKYVPLSGILIAFKDFIPRKGIFGSPWVGLENFEYMFSLPDTMRVLWNTLKIAVLKIAINFPIPIIIAILLNEVKSRKFKKSVQTIIYLPLSERMSGKILATVRWYTWPPLRGWMNLSMSPLK